MAKFIACPETGTLIPAEEYHRERLSRSKSPHVWGDIPGFLSPIDDKTWIGSRAAWREDLKKHGMIDGGGQRREHFAVYKQKYADRYGLPLKGRDCD